MTNLVKDDMRSNTGRNINYLNDLCEKKVLKLAHWRVKQLLPKEEQVERWRSNLLTSLLDSRRNRSQSQLNLTKDQCEEMIKSLCTS